MNTKPSKDETARAMLREKVRAFIIIPAGEEKDNTQAIKILRTEMLLRLLIKQLEVYFGYKFGGHIANYSKVIFETNASSRVVKDLISGIVSISEHRNTLTHIICRKPSAMMTKPWQLLELVEEHQFLFMAPREPAFAMKALQDVFPDITDSTKCPRVPGEAFIYYPGIYWCQSFELPGWSTN